MNLCIHCAHFKRTPGLAYYGIPGSVECMHPALRYPPDPVDGHRATAHPGVERDESGRCGPDGLHFELKLVAPEKLKPARKWWPW